MNEKPIIFSTEMVQAILAGRNTMTRRVVKPQPDDNGVSYMKNAPLDWESRYREPWTPWKWDTEAGETISKNCRYGEPGDALWVRESFHVYYDSIQGSYAYRKGEQVKYPPHFKDNRGIKRCVDFKAAYPKALLKWKPSIHMPREASRITLTVNAVRVERLQEISEADAIAEGVEFVDERGMRVYKSYLAYAPYDLSIRTSRKSFETLWQSIHGNDSWNVNPWVWVIEFKVLEVKK